MEVIYRRRRIAALVLLCLVIAAAVFGLSRSDRTAKPMAINGDTIGRDASETLSDYQARSAAELAALGDDDTVYALVSFSEPLSAAQAAGLISGVPLTRVNALVFDGSKEIALPEPTAQRSREDVFADWLRRVHAAGIDVPGIDGLIVYDRVGTIKMLAGRSGILAIQPAPPGAVWGRIGIQPVHRRTEPTTVSGSTVPNSSYSS